MKINVNQLRKLINEELSSVQTLGPAGPRVGSIIMTLKSGMGPVMFKVLSIDAETGSTTVESDEFGQETIAVPTKDWKSFNTKDGRRVYFNEVKTCWH